jgi:hypothetical protein
MNYENRDVFLELINKLNLKVGCEIGVYEGDYSQKILNTKLDKLYLIDAWKHLDGYDDVSNHNDEYFEQMLNRVKNKVAKKVAKYVDRVEIIRGLSDVSADNFSYNSLDFIYIDADHSYLGAKSDIERWYDKVRPGGVVSGHNYVNGTLPQGDFGVKRAVDEFVSKNNLILHTTNENEWRTWFIIKPVDIILHCTENYYETSVNLIKTLNMFNDNLNIYLYEINFNKDPIIKNVNIINLDESEICEISFKGNINNMYSLDVIKTVFLKSKVILHTLEVLKLNNCIYLDSDLIPTRDISYIFEYFKDITNYPLIQKGPAEYLMVDGKGNPFTEHGFDETKILEYPLMNKLGINMNNRTHYSITPVIMYNKKCVDFLKEYQEINLSGYNILDVDESKYFFPFVDETTMNVLLWKYNYNNRLPFLQINVDNVELMKEYYDSSYETEKTYSRFVRIPSKYDKEKFIFFHGIKSKFSEDAFIFMNDLNKIKNKKKIVLISTYCDTDEKLEILKANIDTIKSLGLDVMVNSPLNLPSDLINKCDYFYLTKDNPTLEWPQRAIYVWKKLIINNTEIVLNKCGTDYGWAHMYQIKKLSEFALTYDYDYFYHIIYDTIIDDVVTKSFMSNDKKCNFYPFHEHDVSFHLMVFNKENLSKFLPYITLESYLSNGGIVENWLTNLLKTKKFDHIIEKEYVDDKISFGGKGDCHNYSKIDNLTFFIEKNDSDSNNIVKIYFYNNNKFVNVSINVMGILTNYTVSDGDHIDLGYKINEVKDTTIEYNNEYQNITNDILKIKHNSVRKK